MIVCNPFIGAEISGFFTSRVGGYKSKNSLYMLLMFYIMAVGLFTPGPFCTVWWHFLIFAGLFQVFGSAVLPSIGGIMNGAILESQKGSSSMINSFFSAIFATVPAPIIYGLVNDKMKDYDTHFCMKMFMAYGWLGVLMVLLAICFKKDSGEPLLDKKETKVGAEATEDINLKFDKKEKDNEEGTEMNEQK